MQKTLKMVCIRVRGENTSELPQPQELELLAVNTTECLPLREGGCVSRRKGACTAKAITPQSALLTAPLKGSLIRRTCVTIMLSQHAILSAATSGTDDGLVRTSMFDVVI